MNPPAPQNPQRPQKPAGAPVVIPNTTRREMLFAVVCAVVMLGFLGYGIAVMSDTQGKASSNTLTGKIVAKHFTPAPEEQISFNRKTGMRSEHIAGEYELEVHVKAENRTFYVPVEGSAYQSLKVGDPFTFIRPRSEQVK